MRFLKNSSPVWRCVYLMFEDMLQTWLIHVYTVFTHMLTPCLKICLHNIWGHVKMILENMFTAFEKTCLHRVWTHVYTKFENTFTHCIKHVYTIQRLVCNMWRYVFKKIQAYLRYACRLVHTMLADMFTQNWRHMLQIF